MELRLPTFLRTWSCIVVLVSVFVSVRGASNTLFPYGPATNDKSVGQIGHADTVVDLPLPVKFAGQSFTSSNILKDGMLSFEPGVRFVEWTWREGIPNPAIDRPFIAPFHYDGFVPLRNPDAYRGKIYYKLTTRARNDMDTTEDDRQFMNMLDQYVMSASVALKTGFTSQFVLKVTWENVSSAKNCSDQVMLTGCPSNTFQVLLIGDGDHTFVIFNYFKMEIPFFSHQLAGLNGGHGRGWTDVVPCAGACAKLSKQNPSRISTLVSRAGSDVVGRYILMVNGDVIIRGGCIPDGLKSGNIAVYPRETGMFGGEMLAVSGNCHTAGTKIYCRFGRDDHYRSEGVMETSMRGRCPVPILTTRGQVELEISIDNMAWKHRTKLNIILPSRMDWPIDVSSFSTPWYQTSPKELRVRWTSDLFSSHYAATLEVNLIGYREDGYSYETPLIMRNLVQLATGISNRNEEVVINPSQFPCTSECDDFEIGLVQLRVAEQYVDNTTKYWSVNFGPVALGWYVNNAMTQSYGQNWPEAKCKAWSEKDRLTSGWLDHLLSCPCTLSQALADWGRWQPDMGCNMFTGSECYYHVGALHCVRSVHPSQDGSGNQCCYERDGNLRYAADTYQGSTPDRSHDWGSVPYGAPNHVPSLSHWVHDVITFYYCCLWVEYGQCSHYMDRRPTKDCKAYVPPHSATVYGDPHITTFDGKQYYFGGSGDFWILKSDALNIQGRFEERENEFLQIQTNQLAPTNLTSVVLWMGNSEIVMVRRAPPGGLSNRKLDIKVGERRHFFETKSLYWQDFHGVSIVNNGPAASSAEDQNHSNFTILFAGGAGVQVAERQGLLHLLVILSPNSGQTQGLLGTLDGEVSNDFKTPTGGIIPIDSSEDKVYLDFSLKWGISNHNESKFYWPKNPEDGRTPMFGDAMNFAYHATSNVRKPDEVTVRGACGPSLSCRRDYYVTNDVSIARATLKTEAHFDSLKSSQKKVATCGLLDIPMSTKSSTVYTLGSVVTVTGCRPDKTPVQSSGATEYTCTNHSSASPQWSPTPDTSLCPHGAESSPQKANDVGMIVGIVIGVVIVGAIVIVVIVLFVRRRGKSVGKDVDSRPVPVKRGNVPTDVVIDPGTDETLLKRKGRDRDGVTMSEVKERSRSQEDV